MIDSVIPIVISIAAFVFSVFTWRERKSKDQRDLFFRINECLIDVDLQRGRRILYRAVHSEKDVNELFRDKPEDYDLANRALAMLNVSALYVERDYIDRKMFMQEWGHVYARIWQHGQYFIAVRRKDSSTPELLWPHFQSLAKQAVAFVDETDVRFTQLNPEFSAERKK